MTIWVLCEQQLTACLPLLSEKAWRRFTAELRDKATTQHVEGIEDNVEGEEETML